MPQVDKSINFNALHILIIMLLSNIIITGNWEYFISIINYIMMLEKRDFWFLLIHISIVYVMLTSLKIELGFRASIKFN